MTRFASGIWSLGDLLWASVKALLLVLLVLALLCFSFVQQLVAFAGAACFLGAFGLAARTCSVRSRP